MDLKKPSKGSLDYAYGYVALSRVRTLNDLLILRPFEIDILRAKIPVDLEEEMERLTLLEKKTLNEYTKLITVINY